MSLTGGTFEKQAAIHAWGSNISGVVSCNADVPGTVVQRFQVARKATDLGNGTWHYEYAVRNHNSERSGRALTVTFPQRHDVHQRRLQDIDSHSGEPYATTDWSIGTTTSAVSWSTETYATNQNANALRWATMYNFWLPLERSPALTLRRCVRGGSPPAAPGPP